MRLLSTKMCLRFENINHFRTAALEEIVRLFQPNLDNLCLGNWVTSLQFERVRIKNKIIEKGDTKVLWQSFCQYS